MAKKIAALILGIIDFVLLIVILVSAVAKIGGDSDLITEGGNTQGHNTERSSGHNITFSLPEKPAESSPEQSSVPEKPAESSAEQSSVPEKPAESSAEQSSVPEKPAESSAEQSSVPEESSVNSSETSEKAYPPADEMSTDDVPTLGDIEDFRWSTENGAYWTNLSSDAVRLTDYKAIQGGWKAYLLDDPSGKQSEYSVERLANIRISGSENSALATIDWYYVFLGSEGEGYDDNSPDTEFSGTWSLADGELAALGAGKLILGNFCYDNGHEYGTGIYMWPDGVEAVIALVRP